MPTFINFFDSNFFIGIITLAVGTVAFSIYRKQQRDTKRDAANVILLEMESAEQQLQVITQNQSAGSLAENIYLMKNSSWDKFRYHFVRDFDRNEWDKITDFYNKCLQYDAAVTYHSSYFAGNVDMTQMHLLRIQADYASEYAHDIAKADSQEKRDVIREAYEKKKQTFINSYGVVESADNFTSPYFYNPQKPVIEAKQVLETIETNLSLTSVGIKLKKMANNASFLRRLKERIVGSK
jgi:hypothetical protein